MNTYDMRNEVIMEKRMRYVNSLTFQMEFTAKTFQNLTQEFFKEDIKNRISFDEFIVLDTLICYPHIDKVALAKTLMKDKDIIDKILSKLLKKKLITETKSNRKELPVRHYEITTEGNRIYNEISPQQDRMIIILSKFITEKELISFTRTLLKIRNILISLEYV